MCNSFKKTGLDCCIKDFVETGKPFIGICLGMQLLFESSEEFGHHKGLGLVKGKVKKFQFQKLRNQKYPIPQVGWNKIKKENVDWKGTLLENNLMEIFYTLSILIMLSLKSLKSFYLQLRTTIKSIVHP